MRPWQQAHADHLDPAFVASLCQSVCPGLVPVLLAEGIRLPWGGHTSPAAWEKVSSPLAEGALLCLSEEQRVNVPMVA